jgi:hypothetical protein
MMKNSFVMFVIRVSNDNEQFREQPIDASSANIDKAVRKISDSRK